MTPHEIELASALGRTSGWVGARFCNDLALKAKNDPATEITLRQRHYLELMAWRYRRQLPRHLVPEHKPHDLPPKCKAAKKSLKRATKIHAIATEPDLFA